MKKRSTLAAALLVAALFAFGSLAVAALEYDVPEGASQITARFYVMEYTDIPYADFSMLSEDGELIIHVNDDVLVYFEDYVPLGDEPGDGYTRMAREVLFGRTLAEVLDGRNLTVTYGISTRSIPPQTTPISIMILFEEAVPLDMGLDLGLDLDAEEYVEGEEDIPLDEAPTEEEPPVGAVTLPIDIDVTIGEDLPFVDVDSLDWFFNAVVWAYNNNIMNGITETEFAPNAEMTRAMLVTVLWRYAGEPSAGASGFLDVAEGTWYSEAIAWAAENGIVTGFSETHFGVNDFVNREQMYTILHRYMDFAGLTVVLEDEMRLQQFMDSDEISEWAREAMYFMFDAGILFTYGGMDFNARPQENAFRGEIAGAMFFMDMRSVAVSG